MLGLVSLFCKYHHKQGASVSQSVITRIQNRDEHQRLGIRIET